VLEFLLLLYLDHWGFFLKKDLLKHIFYDFSDAAMVDLLRTSPKEAFVIQNQ
jgi:hypothetical protein